MEKAWRKWGRSGSSTHNSFQPAAMLQCEVLGPTLGKVLENFNFHKKYVAYDIGLGRFLKNLLSCVMVLRYRDGKIFDFTYLCVTLSHQTSWAVGYLGTGTYDLVFTRIVPYRTLFGKVRIRSIMVTALGPIVRFLQVCTGTRPGCKSGACPIWPNWSRSRDMAPVPAPGPAEKLHF